MCSMRSMRQTLETSHPTSAGATAKKTKETSTQSHQNRRIDQFIWELCVHVLVGLQKRTVLQHKTPIHQVVEDYTFMAAIHKLLQVQGILPLNRGSERLPEQRFDKGRLGRLRWRLQGVKEVPSFAHLNCCESCQVRKHPGACRQGAVKISHFTADFTGLDKTSTKLEWLVWR